MLTRVGKAKGKVRAVRSAGAHAAASISGRAPGCGRLSIAVQGAWGLLATVLLQRVPQETAGLKLLVLTPQA